MKRSAGILLYKYLAGKPAVLLVHPGGPFWERKDAGSWSIPKGEYRAGEDPLHAAIREFEEETGLKPHGAFEPLGEIMQRSGKRVAAWALKGEFDPARLKSNLCEVEWPRKSGRVLTFPEIDRAAWFDFETARLKIIPGQTPLLRRLEEKLLVPHK